MRKIYQRENGVRLRLVDDDEKPPKQHKIQVNMAKGGFIYRDTTYKNGTNTQGDAYSIRLNRQVDIWVGETREHDKLNSSGGTCPQYFYK